MKLTALKREAVQGLPFYNYRKIDPTGEEIKNLAINMMSIGQLVPVLIGLPSQGLIEAHPPLREIVSEGNDFMFVLGGERRTRAFLLMPELAKKTEMKPLDTLEVKYVELDTVEQLMTLQLTENMDRVDSSFTEMGLAFQRTIEAGVNVKSLLKTIGWGAEYPTEKERLGFVQARIDGVKLNKRLWPFLDSGVIFGLPGKVHQLYHIMPYPQYVQEQLAKEYESMPYKKDDKSLKGWLMGREEGGYKATWDLEDEALGNKKEATGACIGCRYSISHKFEVWDDGNKTLAQSFRCLNPVCFESKKLKHTSATIKQVEKEGDFVYFGKDPDNRSWEREKVKDGKPLYEKGRYVVAEIGTCPNLLKAVSVNMVETKVHVAHICPIESKCPVHWKSKVDELNSKRKERAKEMDAKAIGETATELRQLLVTAAVNAVQTLSEKEKGVEGLLLKKIGSPRLYRTLLITATAKMYNAINNYELTKEWERLVGIDKSKHHSLWSEDSFEKAVPEGMEGLALLYATLFYSLKNDTGHVDYWNALSQLFHSIDFEALIDKEAVHKLEEVNAIKEKRSLKLKQEEEAELHCLRFFQVECLGYYKVDVANDDWWESFFSLLDDNSKHVMQHLKVPNWRKLPDNKRAAAVRGRYNALLAKFPDFKLDDDEKRLVSKFGTGQVPSSVVKNGAAGELLSKAFDISLDKMLPVITRWEISTSKYKDDQLNLPYASPLTVSLLKTAARQLKVYLRQDATKAFTVLQDEPEKPAKPERVNRKKKQTDEEE